LRNVTNAGRDAVDADGAKDEGTGCGRRSRVVLSSSDFFPLPTMQKSPVP